MTIVESKIQGIKIYKSTNGLMITENDMAYADQIDLFVKESVDKFKEKYPTKPKQNMVFYKDMGNMIINTIKKFSIPDIAVVSTNLKRRDNVSYSYRIASMPGFDTNYSNITVMFEAANYMNSDERFLSWFEQKIKTSKSKNRNYLRIFFKVCQQLLGNKNIESIPDYNFTFILDMCYEISGVMIDKKIDVSRENFKLVFSKYKKEYILIQNNINRKDEFVNLIIGEMINYNKNYGNQNESNN